MSAVITASNLSYVFQGAGKQHLTLEVSVEDVNRHGDSLFHSLLEVSDAADPMVIALPSGMVLGAPFVDFVGRVLQQPAELEGENEGKVVLPAGVELAEAHSVLDFLGLAFIVSQRRVEVPPNSWAVRLRANSYMLALESLDKAVYCIRETM